MLLGGSGFLGREIADVLVQHGVKIINVDPEAVVSEGNYDCGIQDIDRLLNIVSNEKPEIIIHLVSLLVPSSGNDKLFREIDINMKSTMNFINHMAEFRGTRLIYVSSGGTVYGDSDSLNKEDQRLHPINNYGWSKAALENYIELSCRRTGTDYMIIRPSNPYGSEQVQKRIGFVANAVYAHLTGRLLEIWGDGSIVRDYIAVEDVAEIFYRLICDAPWNSIYNLGSGMGINLNEIITAIENVSGSSVLRHYGPAREVDVKKNVLDMSKTLTTIGGFQFRSLEDGIQCLLDTFDKDISH